LSEATFFESLRNYVGFTDASSEALRAAHPLLAPHFPAIVDDFYATIEAHEGARQVITGGRNQIERLKSTLIRWLHQLHLGPHDEAYFQTRARIGRMHVRIDLPQAYMFTAMDRIRVRLLEVLRDALRADPERLRVTSTALHQILDLELAIMLETYREDLLAKNRTAERLATIGQFAASIGHELRNPLGVMESSVFLLRQHLQQLGVDEPKVLRHLEKISTEVQRSNKTITDLLELARNQPPRRQTVTAAALGRTVLATAPLPAEVQLSLKMPEEITIDGDRDQIARVLSNLILNASQAMGGKGRIFLEAERHPGETWLRVRDEGPGVPHDVHHRIFEALFTTKAKGSGLGLALSRKIAEAHGGTLVLEPTTAGASFLLRIPEAPTDDGAADAPTTTTAPAGGPQGAGGRP
jgi:signal transduction histidine kinase